MKTVIGIAVLALLQLQHGVAQNISPLVPVSLDQLKEAIKEVIHDEILEQLKEFEAVKEVVRDEIASLRAELLEKDRIMQQSLCINHTGEIGMCAGNSCAKVLGEKPDRPSGYYWLKACETCEPFQAFCDFSLNLEGTKGWMRVADFDMTDHSQTCPSQFKFIISQSRRLCGRKRVSSGCDSKVFETSSIQYRKVAGQVIGYKGGSIDAFTKYSYCPGCNINKPYVDGVSITHGYPRNHIWTYAAGWHITQCPCVIGNPQLQPSFVGNDYYCEIGSNSGPLWDGEGCSSTEFPCCQSVRDNSGWFIKELSAPATDGIEVRLCADQEPSNENIRVERIELYVL